jgi:hypothetical protein
MSRARRSTVKRRFTARRPQLEAGIEKKGIITVSFLSYNAQ